MVLCKLPYVESRNIKKMVKMIFKTYQIMQFPNFAFDECIIIFSVKKEFSFDTATCLYCVDACLSSPDNTKQYYICNIIFRKPQLSKLRK